MKTNEQLARIKHRPFLLSVFCFPLCSLLLSLPAPAQVQDFNYETTTNHTITINGYTGTNTAVDIPATITGLPVTSIEGGAFYDCFRLTSITIPNSVTFIGAWAFGFCTSLTSATIPDSVTSIGVTAFADCNNLTNVTIGNGVTNIGDRAFDGCTSLTTINVAAPNSSYSSLDGVLFDKSQTTLISCPQGKTGIYTIPDIITNIGISAFDDCTSLTKVIIGKSVTNIPPNFDGLGPFIPPFHNCPGLSAIDVDPSNLTFSSLDGVLYDKSQTTLIRCPEGKTGAVTIPNTVTTIGAWDICFYWEQGLHVRYAFDSCSKLKAIFFKGNTPSLPVGHLQGVATNATVYYLPGTTDWGTTFGGCPTAPWYLRNPTILDFHSTFGVQTNRFGFTISWATNVSVVIEAATNLTNPNWLPVATNTLTEGSTYFSDPDWANHPNRFYRLRLP